jgi:translation initiation factor IF-2
MPPAAPGDAKGRAPEKPKTGEAPKRPEQIAKRSGRALELEPEPDDDSRAKKKGAKPAKSPVKIGDEKRERTKLTINNAFDEAQRVRSLASL